MHVKSIAVVIPVLNEQAGLNRLMHTLRRLRVGQIIVVDDGSHPPMRARGAQIIRNGAAPRGAGWARNTGLSHVDRPFVLFQDADDTLLSAPFHRLLRDLADTPFDMCLFQHHEGNGTLPPPDAAAWAAAEVGVLTVQSVPPAARPALAGIQNYPWNRLMRTAFLRAHNIRCSETIVHNDIRLHWHGLAAAQQVLAARHICIDHRPGKLSALSDARRLHLLTALAETAPLIPATPDWHRAFQRFSSDVRQWATTRCPPDIAPQLAAPPTVRRAKLRFRLTGPHAHCTPLAQAALTPLWKDHLHHAPSGNVDLTIIAHPHDARAVAHTPLLLVSEEPFWDLLFNPTPQADSVLLPTATGTALVPQITHANSRVFATTPDLPLPYYPLTHPSFAATYQRLFAANARLSAQDWQAEWPHRRWQTAFMAAYRPEGFNDISHAGLRGLSASRTALAQQLAGPETFIMGTGWDSAPRRTPTWHADKIALLDRQSRAICAIENTLHPDYLSEKLFDALACGALPVTLAPPDHATHHLGLPAPLLIPPEGVAHLTQNLPNTMATAMVAAQARMAMLWGDAALIRACQKRVFDRLLPLVLQHG